MFDMFMQSLGWFGNVLFAISAIPQAIKCYRQGHSKGLSMGLLSMWFFGEFIALVYGLYSQVPAPLILNYSVNFFCLAVIMFYYLFPREEKPKVKVYKTDMDKGSYFKGGCV